MTDSLVLGGTIELLGGGVASTHPQCAGAIFRLGDEFDLSAPQMTSEQTAGLLLDGEVVTGWRASNRTPTIPVTIIVPTTGDSQADRLTLAGARELLLQITAQEHWEMVWTRDGADPLIFDCMGLTATTVHYSIKQDRSLVSLIDVNFQAFPYGRSDEQETVTFDSPSSAWSQPPGSVTLDDFTYTGSLDDSDLWSQSTITAITGEKSALWSQTGHKAPTYRHIIRDPALTWAFDSDIANWQPASPAATPNCTANWDGSDGRTTTGCMDIVADAAGSYMFVLHDADSSTGAMAGVECAEGDQVHIGAWLKAVTVARSVQVGVSFYDENGAWVANLMTSTVTDSTSAWAEPAGTLTAPANSRYGLLMVRVNSPGSAGETHRVDDSYIYVGSQAAPLDITGRQKFSFWLGLGTTKSKWQVWHRGKVSFSVTLTDSLGQTLTFGGFKRHCHASSLQSKPHWQWLSHHIPQVASGFDYTTVSRYEITAWNQWDGRTQNPDTGAYGVPVLNASAYLCHVRATASTEGSPVSRALFATLPGIVGSARSPLGIQVAAGLASWSSYDEFTSAGSNNWTAPVGVTTIDLVECWAAGAGGAGSNGTYGGGGGGGGEYAAQPDVPVTAGNTYHPYVGSGGAQGAGGGNAGSDGGDSYFTGDSVTCYAHGGKGGWQSSTLWGGGKGGSGSSNYVHHAGGDGNQANRNHNKHGGGGGSSGGPDSAGNHPDGRTGAEAVTDGGPGGDGGVSGSGSGSRQGQPPSVKPSGGGGGGSADGGGYQGGYGRTGKVRLTYGASGVLPLQSLLVHAPSPESPDTLNPVVSVGDGADTPNGGTVYTSGDIGALKARYDGTYSLYLIVSAWNTPSSSRTVTVQIRQYPYSGGTAITQDISRTITPDTDLSGTQQYVDLGPVTLPLADLPPGSSDAYFAVTVTSTNTSDRFLDVLLLDTQGTVTLLDIGSGSPFYNIWIDQPDASRALGRVLGSDADRDRAYSVSEYLTRISGGPLAVHPSGTNRILLYSAQGAPAAQAYYPPQWWTERLS